MTAVTAAPIVNRIRRTGANACRSGNDTSTVQPNAGTGTGAHATSASSVAPPASASGVVVAPASATASASVTLSGSSVVSFARSGPTTMRPSPSTTLSVPRDPPSSPIRRASRSVARAMSGDSDSSMPYTNALPAGPLTGIATATAVSMRSGAP
jgi:hypothetical protein